MYSGMLGWRTRFGAGSAPTAASVKKSGKSLTGERLRAGKSGSWARKVRKLASNGLSYLTSLEVKLHDVARTNLIHLLVVR